MKTKERSALEEVNVLIDQIDRDFPGLEDRVATARILDSDSPAKVEAMRAALDLRARIRGDQNCE